MTPTPTRPEPTTPTREELLRLCKAMEAELAKVAVLAHSDPRKEVVLCSVMVPYDTMETINTALKQRLLAASTGARGAVATPEVIEDVISDWLGSLPGGMAVGLRGKHAAALRAALIGAKQP